MFWFTISAALAGDADTTWLARMRTTEGTVVLRVHPEWAPRAAAHFAAAIDAGVYDGARIYRVVPGFVAQFGISADPEQTAAWKGRLVPLERSVVPYSRGTVALAGTAGHGTVQVYVNLVDNRALDPNTAGAVFAEVVSGMDSVDAWYSGYGECAPRGSGPNQARAMTHGEAYLSAEFPELDRIRAVRRK